MTLSERLVVLKNTLSSYLRSIKQALTNKNVNINGNLKYRDIAAYIDAIKLGDDTSDATATSSDIREGTKAWVKGELIDGSMPDTSISIDENVVEIKTAGYITDQTHVVGTALPATEYTPGKENILINKGQYLIGQQTIFGDANLLPENIKKGTTIFNIEGNYLFDFQNATTATSSDIAQNIKVYDKNGNLIEGTLEHVEADVDKNVISIPAGIIEETTIQVGTLKSITSPITPGTKPYTIAADTYLDHQVIIEGDTNLVADNIKEGISIFGIEGTCKDLDVSLSTVTQNSMLKGTKAYDSTGTLIDGLIDISADPNISINYNSITGKIVGSVTEYTGYIENDREYNSGVNPSDILPTTYTTEIIPSSSKQTITKNQWIATDITIHGDNELKPDNIKKDISIFGVVGSYEGEPFDFSSATVTEDSMLSDVKAWNSSGELVTGTISTSTPTVSGNTVTIPKGYISSTTTKTVGTALSARTYTPGTFNQTIDSGNYLAGTQTILGDSNLKPENIKKDISIFGVSGSYEDEPFDFSAATVSAGDMMNGIKAWDATGTLITGSLNVVTATSNQNVVTVPKGIIQQTQTITIGTAKSAETFTPGTSDQTISAGKYLTGTQTVKGDINLVSENIKEGITIFNVTGTYTGEEADSGSNLPAEWDDIPIAKFNSYENKFEVTPSLSYGVIGPENSSYTYYIDPAVFVPDIPNLLSENIKDGISILGIDGSYTGEAGELSTWLPHVTHYDEAIPGLSLTAELTPGCIKWGVNNLHIYNVSLDNIIGGIPNLEPENIKSGVSIFGITGTYEGENSGQQSNVVQYPIPKYDEKYYLVYTFMPSSETFGYDLVNWDILEGRDIPANAFTSSGSPMGSMKQIVVDGPYDTFNDINTAIEGKSYRAECTILKN